MGTPWLARRIMACSLEAAPEMRTEDLDIRYGWYGTSIGRVSAKIP